MATQQNFEVLIDGNAQAIKYVTREEAEKAAANLRSSQQGKTVTVRDAGGQVIAVPPGQPVQPGQPIQSGQSTITTRK